VGVVLPFDVQQAMTDLRVTSKAFYDRRDRLPSERVSLVSRGEIRHLLRSSLVWLHRARGLPYAHLWYYPGRAHSVATLRVDTDGAPREDVDVLYRIMHDAGVPGTWFLDVKAHEAWLPHFRTLAGQEIGLHCYEHRFGTDINADEANMRRGHRLLTAAGWKVEDLPLPLVSGHLRMVRSSMPCGLRILRNSVVAMILFRFCRCCAMPLWPHCRFPFIQSALGVCCVPGQTHGPCDNTSTIPLRICYRVRCLFSSIITRHTVTGKSSKRWWTSFATPSL